MRNGAETASSFLALSAFFPTVAIVAGMDARDKRVRCDCGFDAVASDEEELVAAVRRHASETHGIEFTADEALRIVRGAELHLATTPLREGEP
jgi:predicted small metal-binding protein